jgi:XTP/dITP diphosphohydrolase
MEKEIVFATTNNGKLERIVNILKPFGYKVIGLKEFEPLEDVEEDGETVLENALKKATYFSKQIDRTVLAMDTALLLDKVPNEDQPSIFVRRIKSSGNKLTDLEMIDHYSQLFKKYGGKVTGHWETAWAIAYPDGKHYNVVTKSHDRFYVNKPSNKIVPGLPIDSLQIDIDSGKYFSEMSPEERDNVWGKTVNDSLNNLLKEAEK